MSLTIFSRLRFASVLEDADGVAFSTEPEPYLFRELPDTVLHVVTQGESWSSLADRYYRSFESTGFSPSTLWWVIADFQPGGTVDPTIALEPGSTIYVPSGRTLVEEIFTDSRRPGAG